LHGGENFEKESHAMDEKLENRKKKKGKKKKKKKKKKEKKKKKKRKKKKKEVTKWVKPCRLKGCIIVEELLSSEVSTDQCSAEAI